MHWCLVFFCKSSDIIWKGERGLQEDSLIIFPIKTGVHKNITFNVLQNETKPLQPLLFESNLNDYLNDILEIIDSSSEEALALDAT